jgi:hypothetical protein
MRNPFTTWPWWMSDDEDGQGGSAESRGRDWIAGQAGPCCDGSPGGHSHFIASSRSDAVLRPFLTEAAVPGAIRRLISRRQRPA